MTKKKQVSEKVTPRGGQKTPTHHSPQTLITYRVFIAAQAMSRLVDNAVRTSLGLTSRQWRILVIINDLQIATSGEVAKTAGYDHSQVSRVAVELTGLGLVEQRMDETDRRKQLLSVTEKGVEVVQRGLPASAAREERFRSQLSQEDYEAFCRALETLT